MGNGRTSYKRNIEILKIEMPFETNTDISVI